MMDELPRENNYVQYNLQIYDVNIQCEKKSKSEEEKKVDIME